MFVLVYIKNIQYENLQSKAISAHLLMSTAIRTFRRPSAGSIAAKFYKTRQAGRLRADDLALQAWIIRDHFFLPIQRSRNIVSEELNSWLPIEHSR